MSRIARMRTTRARTSTAACWTPPAAGRGLQCCVGHARTSRARSWTSCGRESRPARPAASPMKMVRGWLLRNSLRAENTPPPAPLPFSFICEGLSVPLPRDRAVHSGGMGFAVAGRSGLPDSCCLCACLCGGTVPGSPDEFHAAVKSSKEAEAARAGAGSGSVSGPGAAERVSRAVVPAAPPPPPQHPSTRWSPPPPPQE